MKKAIKHDANKLPWNLLPITATEGMLRVLQFGAAKYAAHNWRKGFAWTRLIAAAFRHLAAISKGEDTDPESGLPHVDHLSCCVAFLSEHQKKGLGHDDRYFSSKNKNLEEQRTQARRASNRSRRSQAADSR